MTEHKRIKNSIDHRGPTSVASKRLKADSLMPNKERKENFGERITALQQLVSPFGKTDTASVLLEALEYIRFLHEQVKVLSAPYLDCGPVTSIQMEEYSLRSRGLCLVPVSSTDGLPGSNGADIWAPIKSSSHGSV